MTPLELAAANGIDAVLFATVFYVVVLRHVWPWDLRGRRRGVVLKRGKRPWE